MTDESGEMNRVDSDGVSDWLTGVPPGVNLMFHGGSRDGEKVTVVTVGEYSLGRSASSTWTFPDDGHVSGYHALLRVTREEIVLVNLSPKNGLLLFGEKLPPNTETKLHDQDVFQLGRGGPYIEVRIGDLSILVLQ